MSVLCSNYMMGVHGESGRRGRERVGQTKRAHLSEGVDGEPVIYMKAQRKRAATMPQAFVPPFLLLPFEFVLPPAGFVGCSGFVPLPGGFVGCSEFVPLPVGLVGRSEFALLPVGFVGPGFVLSLVVIVCPDGSV